VVTDGVSNRLLHFVQMFYGLQSSAKAFDPAILSSVRLIVFTCLPLNVMSAMLQRSKGTVAPFGSYLSESGSTDPIAAKSK
jgi:hypothetical protein